MRTAFLKAVRVPVQSAQIMRNSLEPLGVEWCEVRRELGESARAIDDPAGKLLCADELRFQSIFARATRGNSRAWLELGSQYRLMSFGALGLSMMSARTFDQALRIAAENQELTFSMMTYVPLQSAGKIVGFVADDSAVPPDIKHFSAIRDLTLVRKMLNDTMQCRFPLERIQVAAPQPEGWDEYKHEFGCDVCFDAPINLWELQSDAGSMELPLSDLLVSERYQAQCREELPGSYKRDDVDARLYGLLLGLGPDFPSQLRAAEQLGMSKRSLQRALASQNSSFGAVLDRVREQRASMLLGRRGVSIESIAETLGFSETAAFTRAYKRWTGSTPSQVRKANRSG